MVIVSILLVASLTMVGASRLSQFKNGQTSRGQFLAESLMTEILAQSYADPYYGPGGFGLGSDEVGDGSRNLWDDVDDYFQWTASPPQLKDGTVMTDFSGLETRRLDSLG